MRTLLALLKKDLLLELRGRETVTLMICLALLFGVVVSSGTQQAFLAPDTLRRLYPTLLWCSLLFSATIAIGRSFEQELENQALEGLILSGTSFGALYASKMLGSFFMIFAGHCASIVVLAVLLDVEVLPVAAQLLGVSVLALFAYSAIATLTAGISSTSRLKGLLLPLILLPLLFPLMFGAIELSQSLLESGGFDLESPWFSLLIGLDVVYFVLGLNLYEFVIKE